MENIYLKQSRECDLRLRICNSWLFVVLCVRKFCRCHRLAFSCVSVDAFLANSSASIIFAHFITLITLEFSRLSKIVVIYRVSLRELRGMSSSVALYCIRCALNDFIKSRSNVA